MRTRANGCVRRGHGPSRNEKGITFSLSQSMFANATGTSFQPLKVRQLRNYFVNLDGVPAPRRRTQEDEKLRAPEQRRQGLNAKRNKVVSLSVRGFFAAEGQPTAKALAGLARPGRRRLSPAGTTDTTSAQAKTLRDPFTLFFSSPSPPSYPTTPFPL